MVKYLFSYFVVIALVLWGCSPQKNTRGSRAYHELTTRYNVFFNAKNEYEERVDDIFDLHKDDWQSTLRMFPNSRNLSDTTEKKMGGPFDIVVEKTTKAIQEHSISAKPRRDRDKMGSQAYRDWLRQNEFNPFIDQAWLLLGKAHLQNGDYMEAIAVFANSIRLFGYDLDVVSEAQIWLMRAYADIGWFTDADVLVDGLMARAIPKHLEVEFANSYAFLMLQQGMNDEAIEWLRVAAYGERNGVQRRRLWFLIGQLYTQLGEYAEAFDAFERVKGLTAPNEVGLSALVAQSLVAVEKDKVVDDLLKQAKRKKNEDFIDQIYGAVGNYYLLRGDTVRAIENYKLGEEKSTRNGIEKAYVQERLGDIFFVQKRYVEATDRYVEALEKFSSSYHNYKEVAFRADVLGQLSPLIKMIAEQDSLLNLARMPHVEQERIIKAHIARLKRQDKDDNRERLRSSVRDDLGEGVDLGQGVEVEIGTFYFDSPQQVMRGKSEFRKIWGDRALGDNWRLGARASMVVGDETVQEQDSIAKVDEEDVYSVEFYLNQLPTSEEAVAKSEDMIVNGLMGVGDIARSKLHDFGLAVDSYQQVVDNYGGSSSVLDALYKLHLVFRQLGDVEMSNSYKQRLVSEFPDSEYTAMLTDPDYEKVMSNFGVLETQHYHNTYEAYQNGDVRSVRDGYERSKRLFGNGVLMPKFKLLNALSYAFEGDADSLKIELENLIANYPDGVEADLSKDIVLGLSEGRVLVENASIVVDSDFGASGLSVGVEIDEEVMIQNIDKRLLPHSVMIIFNEQVQKRSELLFAISNHNFSSYQLRSFSTNLYKYGSISAMVVKPFNSYNEAKLYSKNIAADSIFINSIVDSVRAFVVLDDNLSLILSDNHLSRLMELDSGAVDVIAPLTDGLIVEDEIESVDEHDKATTVIEELMPTTVTPRRESEPLTIEQKLKELERSEAEALSQSEGGVIDRDRRDQIKAKEKERKALIKQREKEMKEREKLRKQELKQRERDRRLKIKEQEKIRKAKLKERDRLLREKNR